MARELGLTGWVRNLPEGSVEIVAEGPEPEMRRLVAWARQGPAGAHVTGTDVSYEEATGEFGEFSVAW